MTRRRIKGKSAKRKGKSQYVSSELAWCRLPLVDQAHRLRKGRQQLKLWTVPVFEKVKGNWKKFGSTRDCEVRSRDAANSVLLTLNFALPFAFDVVLALTLRPFAFDESRV